MQFSERLKSLREKKEITQRELAKLINIASSTLAMYETGRRKPDFETLIKLADFFDVSTDYLLGRSNENDYKKPDFSKAFEADNLGQAIERIVNICTEFNLSKEIMYEMWDKAIQKYGLPEGEGVAAHGPSSPGSGVLDPDEKR